MNLLIIAVKISNFRKIGYWVAEILSAKVGVSKHRLELSLTANYVSAKPKK